MLNMGNLVTAINARPVTRNSRNWPGSLGLEKPRRTGPTAETKQPTREKNTHPHYINMATGPDQFIRRQSAKSHPRFSGQFSTLNAVLGRPEAEGFHGSWPLTGKELHHVVQIDPTPYIGQTPVMMQSQLKMNNDQLFKFLDKLALTLDPDEEVPFVDRVIQAIHQPTQTIDANGQPVTLKKIGEGSFGAVYRLNDGHKTYAFKVHKANAFFNIYSDHSPYSEAALGAYLTAHNINKDVVRFYAANPAQGWTLTEFIPDHSVTDTREGKTLKEAGFAMGDDHWMNRVSNVRVDLGGSLKKRDHLFDSSTYFKLNSSYF